MGPAFAGQVVPNAIFVVTSVVWILGELRQGLRRRQDAVPSDRYSLWVLRGCITLGVFLAIWMLRVRFTALGYNPVLFGAGIGLLWSGMALRWWSFWALGRYFLVSGLVSDAGGCVALSARLSPRRTCALLQSATRR